ncbi:MAG: P-II family nitrogen regulator [Methanoregula sp.]|jgi:nitrogen regulatory protein PII 2
MKQIIALIREEQVAATKAALETVGVRGVTFLYATGRGRQKGHINTRELAGSSLNRNMRMQLESVLPGGEQTDPGADGSPFIPDTELVFGFLPKRMIILVVYNEEVNRVVQAIVNANQTGRYGDGRIFICPMISAIRVRTGEQGNNALS